MIDLSQIHYFMSKSSLLVISFIDMYHNNVSGKKFNEYVPAEDYFEKGLYIFDIGQNDLAGAFYSKNLDQVLSSIPKILLEFETGIKVGVTESNKITVNCCIFYS